jgi:hypothetical protein
MAVYPVGDGTFTISSHEVWRAGTYESERAARYAFRFSDDTLVKLQHAAGKSAITLAALQAAAADERKRKRRWMLEEHRDARLGRWFVKNFQKLRPVDFYMQAVSVMKDEGIVLEVEKALADRQKASKQQEKNDEQARSGTGAESERAGVDRQG